MQSQYSKRKNFQGKQEGSVEGLPMKIMVVDDSITMRRIVILNLKKAGYEDVIEAENGRVALGILYAEKSGRPDIILLDWNMPEMTGIDFLREIKYDKKLKHIPVIMVTTESERENVMEALKYGASGYLVKPLTPDKFKEQVIDKLNN